MSADKPRGPWADILDQVKEALEDAGVGAGEVRNEVVQSVGDALKAFRTWEENNPEAAAPRSDDPADFFDEEPHVEVVDGGRPEGAPPSPGHKPDLHVAEAPPSGRDDDGGDDDATAHGAEASAPTVSVRVRRHVQAPDLNAGGVFAVDLDAAQTVYRGVVPHPYRLSVDTGAARILLDGAPAETLLAGQSMDVEAALIRVASIEEPVRGRFTRLPR